MAIGVIDILVRANKSSFSKGLKSVTSELAGFAAKGATIAAAGAAAVAAVGAAGVAGLTALTASSLKTIDDVGKMSDILGIATEKLTGLNHAAGLAGVDSEEFSGAIKKMNVNLANAAVNGGGATDALKTIGLNAKDLVNLSPDEAFLKISDGLKGVQNESQRAALAQEIFGKKGQQLIPLMLGGSEAIKQAQQEAEKLGLTYSRVDAANVEEANDAWSRVWGIFEGIGNTIAVAVAPYLKAAADTILEFALSGDGLKANVGAALEWVGDAALNTLRYIESWETAFWHVASTLATISKWIIDNPISWIEKAFNAVATALGFDGIHIVESISKIADAQLGVINKMYDKSMNGEGLVGSTISGIEKVKKKLNEIPPAELFGPPKPKTLDLSNKAQEKLEKDRAAKKEQDDEDLNNKLDAQQKRADSIIENGRSPLEKYQAQLKELKELKTFLSKDQYNKAVSNANKEFMGSQQKEGASTANVLEAGTTAAFDAINNRNEGMEKPLNELVGIAKQQLEETKKKDAKSAEEVISIF